ncbi:MAG: Plug domain-containing protein [Desulfobacterales bacterium]|nr:Plug domain-containing protein [Desulfobacterales bacterium]
MGPGAQVRDLGEVSVTAESWSPAALAPGGSVAFVTAEEIEASGARNAAEALASVPGFHSLDYGNSGQRPDPLPPGAFERPGPGHRGRGAAGTMPGPGAWTCADIPAESIERIEVLKGGASSLYGADAVGGVIVVTTKREGTGGWRSPRRTSSIPRPWARISSLPLRGPASRELPWIHGSGRRDSRLRLPSRGRETPSRRPGREARSRSGRTPDTSAAPDPWASRSPPWEASSRRRPSRAAARTSACRVWHAWLTPNAEQRNRDLRAPQPGPATPWLEAGWPWTPRSSGPGPDWSTRIRTSRPTIATTPSRRARTFRFQVLGRGFLGDTRRGWSSATTGRRVRRWEIPVRSPRGARMRRRSWPSAGR